MTGTAKLGLSAFGGVAAAVGTNMILRTQTNPDTTDGKPNWWFYNSPWVSAAAPAILAAALYWGWKMKEEALVALIAGIGAAAAVPANDYTLLELRDAPITQIPQMPATDGLRGVNAVRALNAAAVGR